MAAKSCEEDVAACPPDVLIKRVFAQHANFVWRSLRRLGVALSDVDDALQEVFLVVFRRITEYEDRGLMRPWLFTISRQVASHYHRGNKRAEIRHQGLIWHTSGSDIEESLARREAEEVVRSFLAELDEPQRIVFALSDIEGMTAPEIAEALGINLNTVYARIRLARKRFERVVALRSGREQTS
ncbi:MAG TPA: sigma-70 family RNA polymerase sigma factor [Polyangia bacterium]